MTFDAAKNFAKVTVSTGYDASATSIVLVSDHGAKLPAVPFDGIWYNSTDFGDPSDDPNVEVIRATGATVDTLNPIARAQQGSSAATHNTAGKVYKLLAGPGAKLIADIIANTVTLQATSPGTPQGGHSNLAGAAAALVAMHPSTVPQDLMVPAEYNAYFAGPLTIGEGINVTVADGGTLSIL
jgi:hypothetical protein